MVSYYWCVQMTLSADSEEVRSLIARINCNVELFRCEN